MSLWLPDQNRAVRHKRSRNQNKNQQSRKVKNMQHIGVAGAMPHIDQICSSDITAVYQHMNCSDLMKLLETPLWAMDDDDDDFLLDLLTYTCPITGRKRCAAGEPLRWIMLSLFTDAVVQSANGFLMSCISSLKTANCFRTHLPRKRPCSPPKPKPPCRDAQAVEDLDESRLQQLLCAHASKYVI